jgi:hypothetical protein
MEESALKALGNTLIFVSSPFSELGFFVARGLNLWLRATSLELKDAELYQLCVPAPLHHCVRVLS